MRISAVLVNSKNILTTFTQARRYATRFGKCFDLTQTQINTTLLICFTINFIEIHEKIAWPSTVFAEAWWEQVNLFTMIVEVKKVALLSIAAVFALLIVLTSWLSTEESFIRFCCRDNQSCIENDEILASEINTTWDIEGNWKVIKGEPCPDLFKSTEITTEEFRVEKVIRHEHLPTWFLILLIISERIFVIFKYWSLQHPRVLLAA